MSNDNQSAAEGVGALMTDAEGAGVFMTDQVAAVTARLREVASRVLVGQDEAFGLMITCLLSGGHVLLEGVPGTAKTLMARTLAMLVGAQFSRVQCTPDLMPSDLVG